VVQWNRGPLGAIAGHPLNDPRVRIEVGDVGFTLRANPCGFDAILLDVDNGPAAFTTPANHGLYDNAGVAASYAALRIGGALAVWSAWEDRKFEQRLRFHGFVARVDRVRARLKKGGAWHTVFLGLKPAPERSLPVDLAERRSVSPGRSRGARARPGISNPPRSR
jgi:spermidine synthase